jgi:hypothetical protein
LLAWGTSLSILLNKILNSAFLIFNEIVSEILSELLHFLLESSELLLISGYDILEEGVQVTVILNQHLSQHQTHLELIAHLDVVQIVLLHSLMAFPIASLHLLCLEVIESFQFLEHFLWDVHFEECIDAVPEMVIVLYFLSHYESIILSFKEVIVFVVEISHSPSSPT